MVMALEGINMFSVRYLANLAVMGLRALTIRNLKQMNLFMPRILLSSRMS